MLKNFSFIKKENPLMEFYPNLKIEWIFVAKLTKS